MKKKYTIGLFIPLVLFSLFSCNNNVNKNSFIRRLVDLISFHIPGSNEFDFMPPSRDFNKTNIDFYFVPVINAVNRVEGNVEELISDIIQIFYNDYVL